MILFLFQGNDNVVILRDGNSTLYPLARDCADSIRDPQWLDLPPVRCVGAGTLALAGVKSQVALLALAVEPQLLLPRLLRCDLEGVRAVLSSLEQRGSGVFCCNN